MASEFALIQHYFKSQRQTRADVALGIGDDAALLKVAPDQTLAVTIDMLVEGTHFLSGADPEGVGHKSLAVNLSDLAAMGAEPSWVTLALAMPTQDETWLSGFCRGFFALAERHSVSLVGGDTTRGPLTITIQAHGLVPDNKALRRDGARPGDIICVTGTLGDAGLGLAAARQQVIVPRQYGDYLRTRLERPLPRIAQGIGLRGLASAVIDISDGFGQDLGHILQSSGVGARVQIEHLPLSSSLTACLDRNTALTMALGGGDDYELCFTIPPRHLPEVRVLAENWDCRYTEAGIIEAEPGLRCHYDNGTPFHSTQRLGYDHFI